jgi:WD40 repeat protein
MLASGSSDKTILIWKLEEGEEATVTHTLRGHTAAPVGLALSPDERYLASASEDKTVRIWHISAGQQVRVLEGHSEWVGGVAWSSNGQTIVSGGKDKTVRVWKVDAKVRACSRLCAQVVLYFFYTQKQKMNRWLAVSMYA